MSDLFYEEFHDATKLASCAVRVAPADDPYPAMVHLDGVDLEGGLLSDDAKALGELLIRAACAADTTTERAFSR